MSEVVVVATLVAQPGKEAEAEALLASLLEPSHGDEGCLLYALHRSQEDPARFAFVERWASADLLQQHLGSEHLQGALGQIDELFAGPPEITAYEALPGGTAEKGTLAGNAGGS